MLSWIAPQPRGQPYLQLVAATSARRSTAQIDSHTKQTPSYPAPAQLRCRCPASDWFHAFPACLDCDAKHLRALVPSWAWLRFAGQALESVESRELIGHGVCRCSKC